VKVVFTLVVHVIFYLESAKEEIQGKNLEISDLRGAFTGIRSELMLANSGLKKSEEKVSQLEKEILAANVYKLFITYIYI
jgi:predicted  nucleic acid-binding Zn-ribbon protein